MVRRGPESILSRKRPNAFRGSAMRRASLYRRGRMSSSPEPVRSPESNYHERRRISHLFKRTGSKGILHSHKLLVMSSSFEDTIRQELRSSTVMYSDMLGKGESTQNFTHFVGKTMMAMVMELSPVDSPPPTRISSSFRRVMKRLRRLFGA